MANSGSLFALVAVVLLAVVECSPSTEKLASCCTKVTTKEIKEPILGYLVQRANPPCVQAVIFQTNSGLFCSYVRAPWVRAKIIAFENAKAQSTTSVVRTSPVSLLSVITSTASPSSSSTARPSSSATSDMSTGAALSESKNE